MLVQNALVAILLSTKIYYKAKIIYLHIMELIVQKFGGTSVAGTARIIDIAKIVQKEINSNNQVIVVVSAMAGVTNQLINLCREVSSLNSNANLAEYDAALCSGEMVTSALLALNLQEIGIKSRSIFAWQLPILTNKSYSKAFVEMLDTKLLKECLDSNITPVIAGFQGVTTSNRLSTLGRGGSDTTAALVAASMKANRCDIYTDVTGIFTADPRLVHNAKKIDNIGFEEMLELSSSGANILHPRAVELAMRYTINMQVVSSFEKEEGTLITSKKHIMEHKIITGITYNKNLLKLSIKSTGALNFSEICNIFLQNNIHVELMLHIHSDKQYNFIIQLSDKTRLELLINSLKQANQIADFTINTEIAIVSLVGYGIKNDSKLAATIINILAKESIDIAMIQVAEIKIALLIADKDAEKSIRILHEFFELDKL
jgi:aspartate kinase